MKIAAGDALNQLKQSNRLFTELFRHGTLSIEVYKPVKEDLQKPHEQDEIYVVISGSGDFYCDGKKYILLLLVISYS